MLKIFLFSFILSLSFSQSTEDVLKNIWSFSGGENTYKNAQFLEFDFQVLVKGKEVTLRHHLWNKFTGDYTLSYQNKEKKSVEIYFNVNTKLGDVYIENKLISENKDYLKSAYGMFINDTYWLLVPTKLEDSGVNLSYNSSEKLIEMSFENVGLTPGDSYQIFVEETGKISQWKFTLQNGRKGDFNWDNYKDCGLGLMFATEKNSADGNVGIHFPVAHFSNKVELNRFKK